MPGTRWQYQGLAEPVSVVPQIPSVSVYTVNRYRKQPLQTYPLLVEFVSGIGSQGYVQGFAWIPSGAEATQYLPFKHNYKRLVFGDFYYNCIQSVNIPPYTPIPSVFNLHRDRTVRNPLLVTTLTEVDTGAINFIIHVYSVDLNCHIGKPIIQTVGGREIVKSSMGRTDIVKVRGRT